MSFDQQLRCSICPPRQSEFSDLSHLLTHVSSKGHLANLHKLQVRSHQELAAAVQVANYNQWYQEHGLAQLLSERMLTKDAKKAAKRDPGGAIKQDDRGVKDETFIQAHPDESSPSRQVTRNRARNKAKRTKHLQAVNEDDGDLNYSPIQGLRRSERLSYLISPVKQTPLPSSPPPAEDGPVDPALVTPGPNAKLKGKVWPGMNLFDAATPEEQRRRNQKKDGSVVKIMERLSKLVEPTETVYGLDIIMRKQRHIDDLEDNSSLIEGETPVPKSKTRPKRKVLAQISANAPRLAVRKVRAARARSPRRGRAKGGRPDQVRIRSSSVRPRHALQYSPTDEETAEFQHAVRNMHLRKRLSPISVFNDESAAYQTRLPPFLGQRAPSTHSYNPMHQRLDIPHYPWIQPQNQNPLHMLNPYNYRPAYPNYPVAHDVGVGKENMIPTPGHPGDYATNPLIFSSGVAHAAEAHSDSTYSSFSGHFGSSGLLDPFGYAKNPLADAFPHFATPQNDISRDCEDKVVYQPSSECTSQEQTAVAFTDQ